MTEVITSVERRRRWSREDKLRIVAESARPEGTVSQVARAHGIAPSQLFTWRRQLLAAAIGGCEAASGFVPVRVTADPASAAPARVGQPIDIRLPSGNRSTRLGKEPNIGANALISGNGVST